MDLAVRLAMLAILVELSVSANLLTWIGVPYVSDGGNLFVKLHPGSYLLILSFVLMCVRRDGWSVLPSETLPLVFLGLIMACLICSLILTGSGNLIVFLDTFLPAGLLSLILCRADARRLDQLRLLMQTMFVVNASLALVETVAHTTIIPLYLNDAAYQPHSEDFRPTALFDHPLTGSIMAILGLALAPKRRLYQLFYSILMWAALLAYGGRVAAFAAFVMVLGCNVAKTASMVLRRQAQAQRRILVVAAALTAAGLLALTATTAGLGTRLAGHLYWDDSAQVRLAQWQLLDELNTWQILFGTRREDLLAMLVPLHLGTGVEVIENFWLLMFIGLGAVGFPLFVGAVTALFSWCWQRSLLQGRLLLLGVLLVTSTSNSLGRKSTILVCLVGTIMCMPPKLRLRPIRPLMDGRFQGLSTA